MIFIIIMYVYYIIIITRVTSDYGGPFGKRNMIIFIIIMYTYYINIINRSYRCLSVVLLGNMYTKDLATALKSHVHVYMYTCVCVCVCMYM
jgi:hypothetical protein